MYKRESWLKKCVQFTQTFGNHKQAWTCSASVVVEYRYGAVLLAVVFRGTLECLFKQWRFGHCWDAATRDSRDDSQVATASINRHRCCGTGDTPIASAPTEEYISITMIDTVGASFMEAGRPVAVGGK
ncbi:uncharacterized protein LOC126167177 [Schistocerca cancellata]|uniref:uncharacterized protein LOC126167177 n=1 Tax=Schistocerca cancellata TaxID=274614 RepID=UPI002118742B|nr:uncharacterized protein LOC126167177 [Schistocerca cancellata]